MNRWSPKLLPKRTQVKDRKTMYALYQAMDDTSLEKLANIMTLKEAWEILEKAYKEDNCEKLANITTLKH